jgi:hypothetical protein
MITCFDDALIGPPNYWIESVMEVVIMNAADRQGSETEAVGLRAFLPYQMNETWVPECFIIEESFPKADSVAKSRMQPNTNNQQEDRQSTDFDVGDIARLAPEQRTQTNTTTSTPSAFWRSFSKDSERIAKPHLTAAERVSGLIELSLLSESCVLIQTQFTELYCKKSSD